ncbi:hypothetical protein GCM10027346_02180 [Hymenobacter seoulensis]
MSIAPEVPTVLQRLRHETRPYHEALEQNEFNQALAANTVTEAATLHFLTKLYGFLAPYEAVLRQHGLPAEWQLADRYRVQWLLQDLAPDGAVALLPLCPDMPPLHTQAQLLGAMYVMEGSSLGGQVIARQLAKAHIPYRTYFTGRAERTGLLWKSFCLLLEQAAGPENEDEIVASARLTFQKLHAWINQA